MPLIQPRSFYVVYLVSTATLVSPTLCAQTDIPANLEVIQVTAQKRSQNLQEVPVAVTVLTGGDIMSSASLIFLIFKVMPPLFRSDL